LFVVANHPTVFIKVVFDVQLKNKKKKKKFLIFTVVYDNIIFSV